jgi:anti-sigma28 factor (negative regulator of flagellin synthesis)
MQNNPVTSAFINRALQSYNKTSARRPERESVKKSDVLTIEITDDSIYNDQIYSAKADIAAGIKASDDTARVAAIKSRIEAGAYRVSAEEIAKSILGIN